MFGSGSPFLVQVIPLFYVTPRDVVVLLAKHLVGQSRLIAAAAKPLMEIRLHALCVVPRPVPATYLEQALHAVLLAFSRFLPAPYALSMLYTPLLQLCNPRSCLIEPSPLLCFG
jgi:hypothetical protein